jgi:5-formyltetrahydrofolate cyclo-ligase
MANSNFSHKAAIRRRMLDRLLRLDLHERQRRSAKICDLLRSYFPSVGSVGLFCPTSVEPDLNQLWDFHLFPEIRASYPNCGPDGMQFYEIDSLKELQPGKFGLLEPVRTGRLIVPDLLIVPGLAFTKTGHRLGRGGGHFDRFLATLDPSITRIGICFDFQILDELPLESHDQPVNFIVTD